jgi:hypothetical protein
MLKQTVLCPKRDSNSGTHASSWRLAARPVPRATGRPPGQPPTASLLRIFRHAGSLQPSVLFRKNNNMDKWVSLADCCLRHVSRSSRQHRHKAHSTGFNPTALGCRTISDEHEILLGPYAVSIGNSLPTFRRNVLSSSSGPRGLHDPESGRQYVSSKRRSRRLPVDTVQHQQTLSHSHIAPCPPQTAPAALCPVHDTTPYTMSTSRGSSTTALTAQRQVINSNSE